MIRNLEITGIHFELDDHIKDYANKKIGNMDKYIPKEQRQTVKGQVILSEEDGKASNRYTCEVRMEVPQETITAKESTINIYAAIDIVEEKVRTQLQKHKDKQQNNRRMRRSRRMLKQFRERTPW